MYNSCNGNFNTGIKVLKYSEKLFKPESKLSGFCFYSNSDIRNFFYSFPLVQTPPHKPHHVQLADNQTRPTKELSQL